MREQRTFHFEGEFHHLWQVLQVPARSDLTDLQVLDEAGQPLQQTDVQQPDTYTLQAVDGGQRLDWYISAQDIDRTFIVSYRISVAPRLQGAKAVLHWQAVGTGWDVDSDDIHVTLDLPGTAASVTADGPVSVATTANATHVELRRPHLAAHTTLGIRAELPAGETGGLPADEPTDPIATAVQWAALLLALAAGIWFGRRPRTGPAAEREPVHPAIVARLTNQPAAAAVRATLIDLALRGALAIEITPAADWRFSRVPGAELAEHETTLLDTFFPNGVDSICLRDWALHQQTFRTFAQQVDHWYDRVALPEAWRARRRPHLYAVALSLGVLALLTGIESVPGLLDLLLAVVLFILALRQPRLTPAGQAQRLAWEQAAAALARGPIPTAEIAYAVALGLPLRDVTDPTAGIQDVLGWYEPFDLAAAPFWVFASTSSRDDNSDWGSDVGDSGDGGGGGGAE